MAKVSAGNGVGSDVPVIHGMSLADEIGAAAGDVWRYLAQEGPTSLAQLKKGLELSGPQVERAIGWLAREDKIDEDRSGKKVLLVQK